MSSGNHVARCIAGPSRLATTLYPSLPPPSTRPYATGPPSRGASFGDRDFRSSANGYKAWAAGEGKQFAHPEEGARAKWLGGNVPFPGNPSFRPPPPLSNALQDRIYEQLVKGEKDIATLAPEYNISKARISAIHKLKQVEAEFRRQSIPLQTAFQNAMEPLLDMRPPVVSGQFNERSAREESRARASDVSHQTEIDEEARFEKGQGAEGSFGNPMRKSHGHAMERTVWEWREEAGEGSQPFKLPRDRESKKQEASLSMPARLLPSDGKKTAIRFIDMSGPGIPQVKQVTRRLSARDHQREKKRASRAALRKKVEMSPRQAKAGSEEVGEAAP